MNANESLGTTSNARGVRHMYKKDVSNNNLRPAPDYGRMRDKSYDSINFD